jgi:hypothetical protein
MPLSGFRRLGTPIDRRTLATLVGPQIEVRVCDRSGAYAFATGSAQARWSNSAAW